MHKHYIHPINELMHLQYEKSFKYPYTVIY
jgi:hypothetical protein